MGGGPSAPPPPKPAPPLQQAKDPPALPAPPPPPEPIQQPDEVAQVETNAAKKPKRASLTSPSASMSSVNTGSNTAGSNINLG